MSETNTQEAMKRLREERKIFIDRAKGLIKEQSGTIKKIKEHLDGEGATIPEIAEKTGMATAEILWFVMALKKYGQVIEGHKEDDYFKYQLAAPQGSA
jgi:hypothetical protein